MGAGRRARRGFCRRGGGGLGRNGLGRDLYCGCGLRFGCRRGRCGLGGGGRGFRRGGRLGRRFFYALLGGPLLLRGLCRHGCVCRHGGRRGGRSFLRGGRCGAPGQDKRC
ncbi:MAG TPA: hypothetical protein DEQ38_07460 [Elusimicrobia bacterium]|nr:hypothetical protein [Elusimicrobiota bacterium]